MNDTNKGVLIGRLTQDSKLDYLQSGSAKLDFSVAFTTSKKVQNQWVDETNYLNNLTLWGKTAENLNQYMTKGTMVCLEYHLHVDTWEKDGKKNYITKTVIDNVQLLSRLNGNQNSVSRQKSVPRNNYSYENSLHGFTNGQSDDFSEDIPF